MIRNILILAFLASNGFAIEPSDHWAFKPVKLPVPPNLDSDWPNENIDRFINNNSIYVFLLTFCSSIESKITGSDQTSKPPHSTL